MESHVGREPGNRRESLAERVYERIKDDILDERLYPRQPLVEAELAKKYEVSKTPVREALLSLAREGLVEMSSFRGGRVRDFTADEAREIYELRKLLEPFALRRAVPRLSDDDRRSLRALLDEARAAAEVGNRRELSRLNLAFHRSLVAQCGNVKVTEILDRLQDQVRVMSLRFWSVQDTHRLESEQHEAILEAVEAGDADKAADLLGKHILEFGDRYVRQWNN